MEIHLLPIQPYNPTSSRHKRAIVIKYAHLQRMMQESAKAGILIWTSIFTLETLDLLTSTVSASSASLQDLCGRNFWGLLPSNCKSNFVILVPS